MSETQAIIVETVLPYPAETIWRTLTTSELIATWLMPNDFTAEIGHRFNFRTRPMGTWDGVVDCEVLACEPPRLLRYSWKGGSDSDPAKGSRGISTFIVEKGTPGFTVGKKERKLGIRSSDTVSMAFQDVRVPAANRIGEEGFGFKFAMKTLDGGRIGIASQAVGIAQASLDASIKYSKERRAFDQPLAQLQAIQFKIADMATEIDAARLLTLQAAATKDSGERYTQQAAMAKLYASKIAVKCALEAIQIHGGYGYIREYHVERYLRDAKITEIYEGTSEIQRIVIARSLIQ